MVKLKHPETVLLLQLYSGIQNSSCSACIDNLVNRGYMLDNYVNHSNMPFYTITNIGIEVLKQQDPIILFTESINNHLYSIAIEFLAKISKGQLTTFLSHNDIIVRNMAKYKFDNFDNKEG